MSVGRVLVYGGKGALGAACVSHFKSNNYVSTTTNTFGKTQNNVYCLKNMKHDLPSVQSNNFHSIQLNLITITVGWKH